MATEIGQTYDQPTSAPTTKIQAGTIAGASALLLSYLVQTVFGIELPSLVSESAILVVAFLAAYFKRERIK